MTNIFTGFTSDESLVYLKVSRNTKLPYPSLTVKFGQRRWGKRHWDHVRSPTQYAGSLRKTREEVFIDALSFCPLCKGWKRKKGVGEWESGRKGVQLQLTCRHNGSVTQTRFSLPDNVEQFVYYTMGVQRCNVTFIINRTDI